MESRIRIKDIALKAGVSTGTVDRVLHNRGEVAEETRNHILSIVEDLGYTPNILAKSLASRKTYNISTLIPDSGSDNPYWDRPRFGFENAFKEIKDFNAIVSLHTYNLNDIDSFSQSFHKILELKPDGLIFAPLLYQPSLDLIHECDQRNIPYIFIDVNMEGCGNLAYFGQNAEQSGYLSAKLMYSTLPDESAVLVIKPVSKEGVTHHLRKREKGFLSFFRSEENKKGIRNSSLEIDITSGTFIGELNIALQSTPSTKGIFVTNSRAYKIAQFLEEYSFQNITLIGYDLIEKNLEYLEKDMITFLIGQKPEEQGYKSVHTLFNYLISGKQINQLNYSPIDIIMKENIDYYKNFKF
jgi:LacI family transcriptional regulator